MNSKKYLIANWKMNKTVEESVTFTRELLKNSKLYKNEVIICPTFLSLDAMRETCLKNGIKLGAQNCHFEVQGAFTGEISAEMLRSLGVEYVILGHSERRNYFGESDEIINKKVKAALESGLKVILCIGETWEQRNNGQKLDVLNNQLKFGLKDLNSEMLKKIIIAYEPVWAIGTGKIVTEKEISDVSHNIEKFISAEFKTNFKCSFIYGGSVDVSNVEKFLSLSCVDGVLIGGASLNADKFMNIINISENLNKI